MGIYSQYVIKKSSVSIAEFTPKVKLNECLNNLIAKIVRKLKKIQKSNSISMFEPYCLLDG